MTEYIKENSNRVNSYQQMCFDPVLYQLMMWDSKPWSINVTRYLLHVKIFLWGNFLPLGCSDGGPVVSRFSEYPSKTSFSLSLTSGIEKFYASEGYITIFRRKFFVSQCQKISWRNLSVLCFRIFPAAKKFFDKRGGEYQDFPSKLFCLTVPKIWKFSWGNHLVLH